MLNRLEASPIIYIRIYEDWLYLATALETIYWLVEETESQPISGHQSITDCSVATTP